MSWISWAIKHPGPAEKVYAEGCQREGLVLHSVEGWLTGALGELMKPQRQASWHFTLALDGTLYQHYALTAACWASGNREANVRYLALEAEGTQAAPLTGAQKATLRRLLGELALICGQEFTRAAGTLLMHREVATRWSPNNGPTACPSGRYEAFFAELEDEMTLDQIRDVVRDEIRRYRQEENGREEDLLGATQLLVTEALVKRSRAMGRAQCVADLIKANDPDEIPD